MKIESYYQIQFSPKTEPTLWKDIGDPKKSFIESSQKVKDLINNPETNNTINAFRIIEKTYKVSTEVIKVIPI